MVLLQWGWELLCNSPTLKEDRSPFSSAPQTPTSTLLPSCQRTGSSTWGASRTLQTRVRGRAGAAEPQQS